MYASKICLKINLAKFLLRELLRHLFSAFPFARLSFWVAEATARFETSRYPDLVQLPATLPVEFYDAMGQISKIILPASSGSPSRLFAIRKIVFIALFAISSFAVCSWDIRVTWTYQHIRNRSMRSSSCSMLEIDECLYFCKKLMTVSYTVLRVHS